MIDLQNLPPSYRVELIKLGKNFTSRDVLGQGAQTLREFNASEGILEAYGYSKADAERLGWLSNQLEAALGTRVTKRTDQRQSRAEREATDRMAKLARRRGRTTLKSARTRLQLNGDEKAIIRVNVALDETAHANPDSDMLADHLSVLLNALKDEAIFKAAEAAGPPTLERVKEASDALDKISPRPKRRGTPKASERIELLDGLIIENVRAARRSAGDAAIDLGRPALLQGFLLLELYGKPRSSKSTPQQELDAIEESDDEEEESDDPVSLE